MALTQTQLKHARSRLERALSDKKRALKKLHTTEFVGPETFGEAYDWVMGGRYKIKRPGKKERTATYWGMSDLFELSGTTPASIDNISLQKDVDVLQKEYDALMDELILGDAPDILAQIKAFIGDE